MIKTILILSFILLIFPLAKSSKHRDDANISKKKMDTTTSKIELKTLPPREVEKKQDDQGDLDEIDLMAVFSICNETFRIEMSYLVALNNSGSFPDETDRNPKCFIRCVLETTEVTSEDGEIDSERAAVVFAEVRANKPVDGIEEIASDCTKDRDETCKCEKSYQFLKCLMEKEIEKYETSQ